MAARITDTQRRAVLDLLAQGYDRETIATRVGITPRQVAAVMAHVTMGTYELDCSAVPSNGESSGAGAENLLAVLRSVEELPGQRVQPNSVLLGVDPETHEDVYWNPHPDGGSANPHVLVLGESGFGKTYSICCLLAELAQQRVASIVFDYGQGFSPETLPDTFVSQTRPTEIHAGRDGVALNPLQPFPFDLHGPVNVAQRIADTFQRVYPGIGVQQHAVLRQSVLDSFADAGIVAEDKGSWERSLPAFGSVQETLAAYADNSGHPNRRLASTVASHISTVFVFNTFRPNGQRLAWDKIIRSGGHTCIIQLKGLEHSLERVVTEFLLWNLIGFVESIGPGPLRCMVVLDEAHKLSFDRGSPVEKLLREGRKYGLGLILASQQPSDFSPVAFANTATKIVFQIGDEQSTVSRQLHRKVKNAHTFREIYEVITKLPRGWAYVVTENLGRVLRILSLEERAKRWNC